VRADREKFTSLAVPDMTWTFPGISPISGTFVGVDGLLGGIRAIAMTLGQGINGFELLEVYANDHSGVTIPAASRPIPTTRSTGATCCSQPC
jgi:hypothetical protein